MEDLLEQYLELFGSLPKIPVLLDYDFIKDLIQDAIVSKIPVSQEEISKRFEELDEQVDLH